MSTPAPHDAEIAPLQKRFTIPGSVEIDRGRGGLTRVRLIGDDATAEVYLHGAHVCSYVPAPSGADVLFVSDRSRFEPGKPIRGGVPICFPWFSGHGDPPHGTARLKAWDLADTAADTAAATVDLTTTIDPFHVRYRVSVGPALELAMRVENTGQAEASFELALHSYFAVSDVRQIEIAGLDGRSYLDKTDKTPDHPAGRPVTQQGPIRIDREVDRVYLDTADTCILHDPGQGASGRRIHIAKHNAHSTVVWNPWTAKAARTSDVGDDEWQRFVCIESGNVHDNRVTLEPGGSHETRATVTVEA